MTVRAELLEGTDSVYQAEQTLDRPLDPPWLNDPTGLTDQVPAPWTPVSTKNQGQTVVFGCWDRTYQFSSGPLPERVSGGGKPLLAAPVALKLYRDGKPIAWSGAPPRVTAQHATDATVSGSLRSSAATLAGTSRLEFDGMLRTDLTLTPTANAPDRVELEIPIRPEFARYLYHFPGSWGTVRNAAALPATGWEAAFTPFVWLGNEDRGLCWFCESDQNWSPADAKKAVTIVREGDRTVLRLHLWEGKPLRQEVKYTLGFQATPVKAPDKTVWDYRIHHGGDYGLPQMAFTGSSGRIEYPASGQIRGDRGTFECWLQLLFDSDPTLPEEKKRSQGNRMICTLSLPNNTNMGIYWNEIHQGPVVWVRERGEVTFYNGASFAAKRGEWHHLAFTWSDAIRAYIDGREVFAGPRTGLTRLPLEAGRIVLGERQSPFVIDEVRILDEARPPAAPFGPYQPDEHTLLLDHFDAPIAGGATAPATGAAGTVSGVKGADGRFGRAVALGEGEDQRRTALERLSEAGVRTICFHEHWTPWQSHPYTSPENEPKLTTLVEAVHAQKMQLLLYMSRQFADIAPEYALYSEDVLTMPKTFGYNRQPTQQDWGVCWKSHWKEFCLPHLAETMDRFGNDGWYLDGPEWPCPCTNRHHGCGYVRPDGSIGPTYDIFATRDFMRRLYVLTRQRKPTGQLNIHNSTVMVIPTLGWGTSSWDGEQLGGIERGPKVLDVLPLDSFRCEMMGRQWGVPAEFLCYERPYSTHEALSFTLLHDVLVRPNGYGEQLDELSGLWKLADAFGHAEARLLPYWSNADVVKTDAPEVLVTLWSRGAQGLVAVVSNLSEEARTAGVTLELAKLGLRAKVTAANAITKEPVGMAGGRIGVPLRAFDYAMVWVK
ncbi:MAG: hypothetical protein HYU66_21875 [Armatimonadetes bacterium]|nr:hypothetical protein [Armatimonadota bacterium]